MFGNFFLRSRRMVKLVAGKFRHGFRVSRLAMGQTGNHPADESRSSVRFWSV